VPDEVGSSGFPTQTGLQGLIANDLHTNNGGLVVASTGQPPVDKIRGNMGTVNDPTGEVEP
jgi:hypothetical protein